MALSIEKYFYDVIEAPKMETVVTWKHRIWTAVTYICCLFGLILVFDI